LKGVTEVLNVREEIEKMDSGEDTEASSDHSMMDIRFFIGLILLIYGVILTISGIMRPDYASISLGFNLNLIWGIVLVIFGLVFYIPSDKPGKWAK
jgi:uncharacterized membrane protein